MKNVNEFWNTSWTFYKEKSFTWIEYEVCENVNSVIDIDWFTKIKIDVRWETKEVYLENENLRVDSSNWEEINIWYIKVKINKEQDIIEYLDWDLIWEQLFTLEAAIREAKKQWKKLPANFNEFQAILDEVWVNEFMKKFPGYISKEWDNFLEIWNNSYFWLESSEWSNADNMWFTRWTNQPYSCWSNKSKKISVRCIK